MGNGYRPGRSTQTDFLTIYDRWAKAAVSEEVNGVVLLDLTAAFDLVDPYLLLNLRYMGLIKLDCKRSIAT